MVAGKAIINIYPSMKGFKSNVNKELDGIKTASTGTSTHIGSGLKKAFAVGAAAAVALGAAVIKIGKESIEAFNTAAEAQAKLEQTAKNQGWAKGATDDLRKYNSELQKLGIVEDDVLAAGQAQLGTFALSAKSVKKLTPALADLVAATKGYGATTDDASNMANLLGKAVQGNVGALTRYGVTLTDAQKKIIKTGSEEEKVAAITEALAANYGDFNKALAATPQGRLEQLKNRFGDIQEKLGEALIPVLEKVVIPAVNMFADGIERAQAWLKDSPGFQHLMQSMSDFFGDENIQTAMSDIAGILADIAELSFEGLATMLDAVKWNVEDLQTKIDDFMNSPFMQDAEEVFHRIGQKIGEASKSDTFDPLIEKLEVVQVLVEAIADFFEDLFKPFEMADNYLKYYFTGNESYVKNMDWMAGKARGSFKKVTGALDDTGKNAKNTFNGIASGGDTTAKQLSGNFGSMWSVVRGVFNNTRVSAQNANTGIISSANNARNSVSNSFNSIKNSASSAFNSARSTAQSQLSQIPDGASGAKNAIANKFSGTGTAIKNKIGSTYSIGQAVVGGIVNGINASKPGIGTALVSGLTSAIAAAKQKIKSHSPSRLTRDVIGKPIMQGVAVGIETETGLVGTTFVDSLNEALQYQYKYNVDYPSTIGVGMGATAGVNVVNQNITLYETNPAAVAQVLEARYAAALA